MKILFATNKAHFPQRFGGSEASTHELVSCMRAQGHDARVFARLVPGGGTYLLNRLKSLLTRKQFPLDKILGYAVYRGWGNGEIISHGLNEVACSFQPDIIVVQAGYPLTLAAKSTELGFPTIVYLRDVEFDELGGDPLKIEGIHYIANSEFTARRFLEKFGIESRIIPPIIQRDKYLTKTSREAVLFINPNPKKGLEIAIALANARPDIRFIFQESWLIGESMRSELRNNISHLKNVEVRPPTKKMQEVYACAKVVLVPSQWEEAWGRIATEAQLNGIPVLASSRGGLPESVGNGGIIIEFDAPISKWASALSTLWDDSATYQNLSDLAIANSRRLEIQPEYLLDKLNNAFQNAIDINGQGKRTLNKGLS